MKLFLTTMLIASTTLVFAQSNNDFIMAGELPMGGKTLEDAPVRITHWVPAPKYPERGRFAEWRILVPQDFNGVLVKEYKDYRIQVSGKDANGPFDVVTWKNDQIFSHQEFEKSELVTDTMYFENSTPPYDLSMTVFHFYDTEKTANKLMRIKQKK